MKKYKLVLAIILTTILVSCINDPEKFDTQNIKENTETPLFTPKIKVTLPLQESPLFAPVDPIVKENVLKSFEYEVDRIVNRKGKNMNNARFLPVSSNSSIIFVPVISNNYEEELPNGRGVNISLTEPFKRDEVNVFFYQMLGNELINRTTGEYWDLLKEFEVFPKREASLKKLFGEEYVDGIIKREKTLTESERWGLTTSSHGVIFEALKYALAHAKQEDIFIYRNPNMPRVCYFYDGEIYVCKQEDKKNGGGITAEILKPLDVATTISYDLNTVKSEPLY